MCLSWAYSLVDRALDSRSKGLGFDSHCCPCVEVLGKLRIPHCFGPPSRNGYLVHRSKVGSIVAGCIGAQLARGKVKSVEHALSWSLNSKQLPLPLHYATFDFLVHKHLYNILIQLTNWFWNDETQHLAHIAVALLCFSSILLCQRFIILFWLVTSYL